MFNFRHEYGHKGVPSTNQKSVELRHRDIMRKLRETSFCVHSIMASSKRPRIDLEKFIENIRKYPCLYDKRHPDYKNVCLKHAIWTAIGKSYDLDASSAESRWKTQRNRYTRENKKVEDSKRTGSGRDDIYVLQWYLYNVIDGFMRRCPQTNEETINNISPILSIAAEDPPEDIQPLYAEAVEFSCPSDSEVFLSGPSSASASSQLPVEA
ncbi:uncharacterized protein LOC111642171 [Centruroides sculpturatus]|uniref:uncharacterized protein LOC111642171 n=1 Tax=Centruroides sculpturatus TaxID=218467 RepID=UPI000C6D842A|nr:uncharacterized protein LOC111642171 [Centruroides sculpturatus]